MSEPTSQGQEAFAQQEQPKPAPSGQASPDEVATEPPPTVVVRYGLMMQIGEFRHKIESPLAIAAKVVVRTERGVELGEVVTCVGKERCNRCIDRGQLAEFLRANGAAFPFRRDGKVLRLANHQDIIDHRHLASSAGEARTYCRQQIRQLGLDMDIVAVEHLLGGGRLIFYFMAESRVDFRELVRLLASQYRTRIEMRQIGARDEARLVGDYERCGQRCCCQQYLKDLKPISMRMAKTQKATLDPTKISGRCGRLMCCLRYEDAGYEELRAKLPKRSTYVRTQEVIGKVVSTQILTQLVRLALPDKTHVVVSNEDIIERNLDASQVAAKPDPKGQGAPIAPPRDDAAAPPQPTAEAKPSSAGKAPQSDRPDTRKRRRGRRGGKGTGAAPRQATAHSAQSSRPNRPPGEPAPPPQGRTRPLA